MTEYLLIFFFNWNYLKDIRQTLEQKSAIYKTIELNSIGKGLFVVCLTVVDWKSGILYWRMCVTYCVVHNCRRLWMNDSFSKLIWKLKFDHKKKGLFDWQSFKIVHVCRTTFIETKCKEIFWIEQALTDKWAKKPFQNKTETHMC